MRIVHLSTSDVTGGAARAAYRLHTGLHGLGIDSSMLVAQRQGSDPNVRAFEPPSGLLSRLHRRLRRERISRNGGSYRASRPNGYEAFSDDRSESGTALCDQIPDCDVINLHWIAGFVDYTAFFRIVPQRTPVVWRLADMNAFTGGCHYDDGCGKYKSGCGACPQLGSNQERDLAFQVWRRKELAFSRVPPEHLHIVAPSLWTAKEAGTSTLLRGFPITVIPNALDIEVFSPRDQRVARDALGVPQGAKVILFVSDRVSNKRKGLAFLIAALTRLCDLSGLFLVSLGRDKPETTIPIPHLHFGYVGNDRLLSLVYSAADVYAIPSLQESFGQTVLEAMACGTPVVGFDVGGIPDMVRPGISGLLAPRGDVDALGQGIAQLLLDSSVRSAMSINCRRIVVEEYALEVQARRYVALYENMLVESYSSKSGLRNRGSHANIQCASRNAMSNPD